MRTAKSILTVLFLMAGTFVWAQQQLEDAIYLKDGTIYRGIIIEQVPNVSYRIQSNDGNTYAVKVDQVEKITKEQSVRSGKTYGDGCGHFERHGMWGRHDTIPYEPKRRGYFFEGQVLLENVQGGLRLINGYKFGRWGYLGIGTGFDHIFSSPFNPKVNGLEKKALAGTYIPLYLYYAGDGPTRGRVTPYFALEAGYFTAFKGWDDDVAFDDFGNRSFGGPMAGVGLGFKMRSKYRKGHFSLLFNVNYKRIRYQYDQYFLSSTGQITGFVTQQSFANMIFPGIRFGIGF